MLVEAVGEKGGGGGVGGGQAELEGVVRGVGLDGKVGGFVQNEKGGGGGAIQEGEVVGVGGSGVGGMPRACGGRGGG